VVTKFKYEELASRTQAAWTGVDEELLELLLELELELETLEDEEDEEDEDEEEEEEEEEEDEDDTEPQTVPVTCGTSAAEAPLEPCMPNSIVWLGWMIRFQLRLTAE
jgi:hypothetical protein